MTDPQYFALKKKKILKQFFQESEDKHAKCNRSREKLFKIETTLDSLHYTPAQKLWKGNLETFISLTIKLKAL